MITIQLCNTGHESFYSDWLQHVINFNLFISFDYCQSQNKFTGALPPTIGMACGSRLWWIVGNTWLWILLWSGIGRSVHQVWVKLTVCQHFSDVGQTYLLPGGAWASTSMCKCGFCERPYKSTATGSSITLCLGIIWSSKTSRKLWLLYLDGNVGDHQSHWDVSGDDECLTHFLDTKWGTNCSLQIFPGTMSHGCDVTPRQLWCFRIVSLWSWARLVLVPF